MGNKAWKQFERKVGEYFGVMRNIGSGTMGRHDHAATDVHHPALFIEAKHRAVYGPLAAALKTTRDLASRENRVGVLLLQGGSVEPPVITRGPSEQPAEDKLDASTLVVHGNDLLQLAMLAHNRSGDVGWYDVVKGVRVDCPPRLGGRLAVLEQTESLVQKRGDMRVPVVAFQPPRGVGLVLAFRPWHLQHVAHYAYLGAEWVMGERKEMCDLPGFGEFGRWWGSAPGIVPAIDMMRAAFRAFDHLWQIPKKKVVTRG